MQRIDRLHLSAHPDNHARWTPFIGLLKRIKSLAWSKKILMKTQMNPSDQSVFSAAGAGHVAHGFGPHRIRLASGDTAGRLGVFEAEVPRGSGPPLHVHEREEELFRVLEGAFAFWCNGIRVDPGAGGVIAIPRGAVHRFENIGAAPGRLMVVMTPGGFEGFFSAVETETPENPQALDALAARFDLRFVPARADKAA
ncbi:cupin domain-containing protein [Rhodovulum viride]|nr:cupin domain-containing protein [Rhodovulum viride]